MKKLGYFRRSLCFVVVSGCLVLNGTGRLYSAETLAASTDAALSLERVFQLAEKNTPGLQARLKKIQAMQKELEALPKWYLPEVSAQAGYSLAANGNETQHGPLARVVGDWVLWDGGRTSAANAYKKTLIASEIAGSTAALYNYKVKIASVYYSAVLNKEMSALAKAKADEYARFIKTVRRRAGLGRVGSSDVRRLELIIQKQALIVEERRIGVEQGLIRLQTYLGLSSGIVLPGFDQLAVAAPADPAGPAGFETLPWVRYRRARIRALAAKIQSKERELYWPSLGAQLYGGYGPHIDAIDTGKPEVGAALTVTVPLFSRADRSAQLDSVRLEIEAEQAELEQELRDARLDFAKLKNEYTLARNNYLGLRKITEDARKNLEVAYAEYSRGLISYSDMQSNLEGYFKTYSESVHAAYAIWLAALKLKLLTGSETQ